MSSELKTLDLPDDYYLVPNGKVVTAVTWLQQFALPARSPRNTPEDVTLEPWVQPDLDEYLSLFREIGAPWLWMGRLVMAREKLALMLAAPTAKLWQVKRGATRIGILELEWQEAGDVEVAYFGLVPGEAGKGTGGWLMDQAQRIAWGDPQTRRLWLHTCTADSPAAIPFYMKMGFEPYATGIEIGDDPRHSGLYSETDGPVNMPVIPKG